MGWSIYIDTDKQVTESVVDKVIQGLPESMKCGYIKHNCTAWSIAVDVQLKNPHELGLSGSYGVSGCMAEGVAEAFARRLEKLGYTVEVGEMS